VIEGTGAFNIAYGRWHLVLLLFLLLLRGYLTLLDAARRCSTLLNAARRCSTLLDAARRCSTLLDAAQRCSTLHEIRICNARTRSALPEYKSNLNSSKQVRNPQQQQQQQSRL
jgi:hypothetical protein